MSGELACLYLELWVGQDCDGIDCYPACCQGSELTYLAISGTQKKLLLLPFCSENKYTSSQSTTTSIPPQNGSLALKTTPRPS